jgi:SWI/SNF-related matrix-associated actin-dependent regulator 1 of chromatin subfamily A
MKKVYWQREDKQFKIMFSGNDFKSTLEQVKTLVGRDFKQTYWVCPESKMNYDKLFSFGFEMCFTIADYMQVIKGKKKRTKVIDHSLFPGFREYQIEGVQFFEDCEGKALNSDDMGTGKSAQALGYLKLHPELRPALVICPAILKINWQREVDKWLIDEKVEILNGEKPGFYSAFSSIYIINYDILAQAEREKGSSKKKGKIVKLYGWIDVLKELKLKAVIIDECHRIGEGKSIRAKAVVSIAKGIKESIIGLSGTPIKNRVSEFFTILNLIDPVNFPSQWHFLQKYCGAKKGFFGWTFNGLENWEELRNLLQSIMIRRKKKDVLKELPEKNIIIQNLEVSDIELKKYKQSTNTLQEWITKNIIYAEGKKIKLKMKGVFEVLKQHAYIAKRDHVIKWIENFLESGEKLVIGAYHIKAIDDLVEYFKCDKIDGSVSMEKRQVIIDRFQNDKSVKLLVGQINAMGEGITLTAASNMVIIQFGWNPAEHDQLSDRLHRIGQLKSVSIYYLIALGTIEETIIQIIQRKSSNINKVLDGDEKTKHFDSGILHDLIEKYRKGELNVNKV